jgi:hypothetical protein
VAVESASRDIVVYTRDANLGDVLVDGSVGDTMVLGADEKGDTYELGQLRVEIEDVTALDTDALRVHVHHAGLTITPTLDFDVAIRRWQLESFAAVRHGEIAGDIDVEVTLREAEIRPKIRLWEAPPQVFVQMVGWVPVVETVQTSVGLRVEVTGRGQATVRLQGNASVALAAGARYEDGEWRGVAEESHGFSGSIPVATATVDGVAVRAYLFTEVAVRLYGLVGPYLNAGPYVQVDHPLESSEWLPSIGLYGEIGGNVRALGFNIPVMPRIELFDVSQTIP